MDIEVLIQDVRDQLDEPPSSYLTQDMILRWLNQAQKTIIRLTRCAKTVIEVDSVAGQYLYEVEDCMAFEEVAFFDSDSSSHKLKCISLSKAAELGLEISDAVTGTPDYYIDYTQYSIGGTPLTVRYILVLPTPATDDLVITIYCVPFPPDMVCEEDADGNPIDDAGNVDPIIPEEYQDSLITWCRYKKLAKQEDPLASTYRAEFFDDIRNINDMENLKNIDGENEFDLSYGW